MKIRLLMLGKTRRAEVRALVEDYVRRIGHYAAVEVVELRDAAQALRTLAERGRGARGKSARVASGAWPKAVPGAEWVLLDAGGRQFSSQEFARWLSGLRDRGTREVVFLCGDAEGFPDQLRNAAHTKLSLSPLTLPHELARVVLAEQLYRAFTILSGHPYPR